MRATRTIQQMFARQRLQQGFQRAPGHAGSFGEFGGIHHRFAAAVKGDIQHDRQRNHSTVPTRKKLS